MYALVLVIGAGDRPLRPPSLACDRARDHGGLDRHARLGGVDPLDLVSLFLLGLGWNISYVAATAKLVTHATPVERGRLLGFTDLAGGMLAAGLALLGGVAYTEIGVAALAIGATVAVVLPALPILVAPRRPARPAAPEPAG